MAMTITLTPHDLIERCLWFDYEYYILKDLSAGDKAVIVRENKQFTITERDAFVINLLKCIHTDNLVHKMNQFLQDQVVLRHVVDAEGRKLVSRDVMLEQIARFRKQFPASYEPNQKWKNAIHDVERYTDELKAKIMLLQTTLIEDWPHVNVVSFKKILDKHHG
jgi:hypothetical protein